jgi:hypothetical protein
VACEYGVFAIFSYYKTTAVEMEHGGIAIFEY